MSAPREPHPMEIGPVGYGIYIGLRSAVLYTIAQFARSVGDGTGNGTVSTLRTDTSPPGYTKALPPPATGEVKT